MRITLKLATSIDGRIATAARESRWITSEEARAETHKLRAASGAVVVGAGTALSDDPELTARTVPEAERQPLRVVLDSRFTFPVSGKLLATLHKAPLLVIGAEGASAESTADLRARGAEIALVPASAEGVDLKAAFAEIVRRAGSAEVLVEGGRKLAGSLVAEGLVDRLEWFRAPILLGEEGVPAIGPLAVGELKAAPTFKRVAVRELGPDLWESYERA